MPRISLREAALLFRRVATGLGAGVDMRRVWQLESSRGSTTNRRHTKAIYDGICGGETLTTSMKKCDGYFPSMATQLVEVGEKTGKLEAVLSRLADHYDHALAVRRVFIGGIAWPAFQLGCAVAIIGGMIWIIGAILPRGPDGAPKVDPLGFGLYGFSGLVIYLLVVAAIAGLIALLVLSLQRGWMGPAPLQIAMRVPGIGGALQTMCLSRFSWSLALALESGLDARRSMALALRSTQNRYYTAHLESVDSVILNGGEFNDALRQTRVFPDEFVDTLAAAELAGTQAESMMRMSDEYQKKANMAMKMLAMFATGAIWLMVLGIFVLLIMRLAMFYIGTIYSFLP